jgi:hypothetical protein
MKEAAIMANVRSPNYPAISLPEAIKRVALVYKQEQRHPADKEVIAKAIGYGSLNGGSIAVISALTKYELLEPSGKGEQLKVSGDALDILIHDLGEHERVRAIQKVAFMPSLFNELYNMYGMNLPSDHSLRATLIKKGFNQKTVDGVIRIYRDTIEFVNVETQDSNMESLDEVQEVPMQTQTGKQMSPSDTWRSDLPTSSQPEKGVEGRIWSLDLAEDCSIKMVLTGRVTKEALDTLVEFIELSKKAVPSASSKKASSSEPETDHHENE